MRVSSTVYEPFLAGVYALMLPLWSIIFLSRLGDDTLRGRLMLAAAGVVVVVSLAAVVKAVALARIRVDADAGGVRLLGITGFSVAWGDVATLTVKDAPRSANVSIAVRPPATLPSEWGVGRPPFRRVCVEPRQLGALIHLARAAGVHVDDHRSAA